MKRLLLSALIAFVATGVMAQFIHPGILNSKEELLNARQMVKEGRNPWKATYEKLKSSPHTSLTWRPSPQEKVVRGGGTIWEQAPDNYGLAYRDAATAYQCAVMWWITEDKAYAEKAIQILNAWARTCKAVSGDTNASLAAGLYGYEFANAGELMRDYEGWRRTDFEHFCGWMRSVWFARTQGFLIDRHGTIDEHYWSNWGLCNVLCGISVGILCDDEYIYSASMEYYKYMKDRKYSESLCNLVVGKVPDERGPFGYLSPMQESGRDQGHTAMAASLAIDICGVGLNQGDDLYAYDEDRLAMGIEYILAYNLGVENLPWVEYSRYSDVFTEVGSGGRGSHRPGISRFYSYYKTHRGVEMRYAHQRLDEQGWVELGGGYLGGNSGGYDQLGFHTLLNLADTSKVAIVTPLGGRMAYGGVTYEKTNLANVPKNTNVTLTAYVCGDDDKGSWTWEDDPSITSPTREVALQQESRVLRAIYTNSQGVKSKQMFCIHIDGDGWVGTATPYYKYNGKEYADTLIYVAKYSELILGMKYSGLRTKAWRWERSTNGGASWSKLSGKSSEYTQSSVTADGLYRVTMTDVAGVEVSMVYDVRLLEIDAAIHYGTTPTLYDGGVALAVEKGTNIVLTAMPNSTLAKSSKTVRSYTWSVDDEVIREVSLEGLLLNDTLVVGPLEESMDITLCFSRSYNGGEPVETRLTYALSVYEANTLQVKTTDTLYIMDAATGYYLRNTDATLAPYDEAVDGEYLWKFRKLPTYGNRYLISAYGNTQHISEEGKMTTTSTYSKHTFNLLGKDNDKELFAISRSSSAGSGRLVIVDNALAVEAGNMFGTFPFRIVKKGGYVDTAIEIPAVDEGQEAYPIGNDDYYDLSGRKVVNPTKGLYIRGGRLIIVK